MPGVILFQSMIPKSTTLGLLKLLVIKQVKVETVEGNVEAVMVQRMHLQDVNAAIPAVRCVQEKLFPLHIYHLYSHECWWHNYASNL